MMLDAAAGNTEQTSGPDTMVPGAAVPSCGCGSMLPATACCALDASLAPAAPDPPEATLQAIHAARSGGIDDAAALCIRLLTATPTLLPALHLLFLIRRDQERRPAALALARRLARLAPRDAGIALELGTLFFETRRWAEAEHQARHAVRLSPMSAGPHELLSQVFQERKEPVAAEFHIRRALELSQHRRIPLLRELAQIQIQQGALAEARATVAEALERGPDDPATLAQMAVVEEYSRNQAGAARLLDRAAALTGGGWTGLREARARLLSDAGDHAGALAALAPEQADGQPPNASALLLKGRILDRLDRTEAAFAAFEAAQQIDYEPEEARRHLSWIENTAQHYRQFFLRSLADTLPRAAPAPGRKQPVFVAGFARSGTTLVEQTLSMHSQIGAGGEIGSLRHVVKHAQRLLHSPLPYPNALTELWMGDQRRGLDTLRDAYLNDAEQMHGIAAHSEPYFTDKMIFNEMHLALIGLILPAAPVIHMIRHPLDVVLSVFSHQLSGGVRSRGDIVSIARHYAATMDLVEHYAEQGLLGRYMAVRYEDVVSDQRAQVARMLDFIGLPFEQACLDFDKSERYARTLSFSQVRRKLNSDGVFRYRRYRGQLEPVYAILEHHVRRLGYELA